MFTDGATTFVRLVCDALFSKPRQSNSASKAPAPPRTPLTAAGAGDADHPLGTAGTERSTGTQPVLMEPSQAVTSSIQP